MVTPVQALRLCTGRTAHRGSRGTALLFHDHGTRKGWGVSVTPRPLFTPGKDPVPIVQEAVWAPGPVWTGAENLALSPGFDPWTVQPVANRYTDWPTGPTCWVDMERKYFDLIHLKGLVKLPEICISSLRRRTHFRNWMIPGIYGANRHCP